MSPAAYVLLSLLSVVGWVGAGMAVRAVYDRAARHRRGS